MPRKGTRGITLIELLTVLAIMTIVASIVYPVYFSAVNYAHRSSCASNLQQIAMTVELFRQEGNGYPDMPGYVGQDGIPQGGVTGLANTSKFKNGEYLWCIDDRYPKNFPEEMWSTPDTLKANGFDRDLTVSSYDYGYNYYGYVTATDGVPFPVTTPEAASYFFGDPKNVDINLYDYLYDRYISQGCTPTEAEQNSDGYPNWDLGLVDAVTFNSQKNIRPRGLFQGLVNTWAPQNTLVTFCPHHYDRSGEKGSIIGVTLNGTAQYFAPVQPMIAPNVKMVWGGTSTRKDVPGGATAPIDWRVNKISFTSGLKQNSKLFGDAPRNALAQNMPVVQVVTRSFRASELSPANPWYDTGIPLQPHDYIMVMARAKWRWSTFDASSNTAYASFANANSQVWFTAAGDPVEAASDTAIPGLLLPRTLADKRITHGLLVGNVGGGGTVFPLGNRGSYLVPDGATGTLGLTMNDDAGNIGNIVGWCQVWIAIFRP